MADIIAIRHQTELTQPTEVLLRDILPEQLIGGLIQLLPQLLDSPNGSTGCPEGSSPVDFDASIEWINTLLDPTQSHFPILVDLSSTLVKREALWDIRNKAVVYLNTPELVITHPINTLQLYMAWDNDLTVIDTVGSFYQNETLRTTGLIVLSDAETSRLLAQSTEEAPGPLSLVGSWIYSDTLSDAIEMLDGIFSQLIEQEP